MTQHERIVETRISSARFCFFLSFHDLFTLPGNSEGTGKQDFLFSSAWPVIKY